MVEPGSTTFTAYPLDIHSVFISYIHGYRQIYRQNAVVPRYLRHSRKPTVNIACFVRNILQTPRTSARYASPMPQVTRASVRRLEACTLVEWIRDCIAIAQGAEQRQDGQLYAEAVAELRVLFSEYQRRHPSEQLKNLCSTLVLS